MEKTSGEGQETEFWNSINDAKEMFWEATACSISGNWIIYTYEQQKAYLDSCIAVLQHGVEKAEHVAGNVPPTYFYYEVKDYEKDEEGILPVSYR